MSESYLIFGGSGFIGTHLTERSSRAGIRIVSADIVPPRAVIAGVDYQTADVRDLSNFELSVPVDRIYLFAAVHTTPGHPDHDYYETNICGALEVARFAERHNIQEIVFTSSISVYGTTEQTKDEASLPAPESPYGRSKLMAEKILRHWAEQDSGRKLTIVRPAVVFGRGEGGNFTRMAKLLGKGFFVYPGRKDTIKACIYVEDLLLAIEFARAHGERQVTFNAAYPQRYTLEQIVQSLIVGHFPTARTVLVPRRVVTTAAAVLGPIGFLNIGIHPQRVTKLVRSTDVYPGWLVAAGFQFPEALGSVMRRWSDATNGSFV